MHAITIAGDTNEESGKRKKLTEQKAEDILSEIKQKETDRVVFKTDQLHKYFPRSYSAEQMKREIIDLLKLYVTNY